MLCVSTTQQRHIVDTVSDGSVLHMTVYFLIFILLYFDVSHANTTTSPVLVRLAGDNTPPYGGRLEIYYNGVWGTVCDDGFDNRDADVACYMLGFGRSGVFLHNFFGAGSGEIWLDDVDCIGSEVSLADCAHRGWGSHNCGHYEDVSIVCDRPNCTASHQGCETVWNTNVRYLYNYLIEGTLSEDRLQTLCSAWSNCSTEVQHEDCSFYYAQHYYQWSQFNTLQLYNEAVDSLHHLCNYIEPDYTAYKPCYQSPLRAAVQQRCGHYSYYGSCSWQQSLPYCYARVIQETCNASSADINVLKTVLYDAKLSGVIRTSCVLDFDQLIGDAKDLSEVLNVIAGVLVRLAGDNRPPNAGRLEIYYNGTWGTVCSRQFDNADAQVACYMLGFGRSGLYLRNYYGSGSGEAWLDDLRCTGYEHSLAECQHSGWGDHNCYRYYYYGDVSIICGAGNCTASHPGCETIWNTYVPSLYRDLIAGTLSDDRLQTFCSAFDNCSTNVQGEGCTFHDLFTQVLQYSYWSQFNTFDGNQQRYNEAIDSLYHLCSNIEPGQTLMFCNSLFSSLHCVQPKLKYM